MKKFCVMSLLLAIPLLSMGGCTTLADARKDKCKGTARIYKAEVVPFSVEGSMATPVQHIKQLYLS